jgi:tetratricopeptide (TPR) repeat protein
VTPHAVALLAALLAADPAPPGGPAASPPDPAAATEALRFADWLEARGDHYRAIGEYERYLFLAPGGTEASRAELEIARAYARGGKPDAAVAILRRLAAEAPEASVRDTALFEQGLVRVRAGTPELALPPLSSYARVPGPAGGPGPGRAQVLLGLSHLRLGDTSAARAAFDLAARTPEVAPVRADLAAALADAEGAPHRSPVAAGLLSAVVPGLGHVYAGDPWAGAGALLLNGAFIWATVEAFQADHPGLGVVLLTAESIWYGGAIFGAVAEAHRFNRDGRSLAAQRAEARLGWALELAPLPGGAAAGLRGGF